MTRQEAGQTARFIIQYDDAVGPALACAQALLATVETDLDILTFYLPLHKGSITQDPLLTEKELILVMDGPIQGDNQPPPQRGGGSNSGSAFTSAHIIRINPIGTDGNPVPDDLARLVFVAEMAEQLMGLYGWSPSDNQGEALSRVLAETLYPDPPYTASGFVSPAPWVNLWFNSAPRGDFIATPSAGDTNQITYGCAILFIYYMRDQLGIGLDQICQVGGSSLLERYQGLTGNTDDGVTAMANLLDAHFSAGAKLPSNDPFPLLDAAQRTVTLSYGKATTTSRLIGGGIAHTSPFILCPAKDYRYFRVASTNTRPITATARGFGQPRFRWSLKGVPLASGATNGSTWLANVEVEIPNPADLKQPSISTQPLACGFSESTSLTRQALSSTLTVWNKNFSGTYLVDLEVEVTEAKDGGKNPTVARTTLALVGAMIFYEPQYYTDQQQCEQSFAHMLSQVPRLQEVVDLVKNAPDPAPDWLQGVIAAVDDIRSELQQMRARDPQLASNVARYVADRLGLPQEQLVSSNPA